MEPLLLRDMLEMRVNVHYKACHIPDKSRLETYEGYGSRVGIVVDELSNRVRQKSEIASNKSKCVLHFLAKFWDGNDVWKIAL